MTSLKRSADRKVTNGIAIAANSGNVRAVIANSFGLPSGKAFSCPGATSVCENVCYAGKLEKIYKGVANVLLHNWNALKDSTVDEMTILLQEMVDAFRVDCDKYDKKNGGNVERAFRIHWDGDFFSLDYAMAWANVISANADIAFWVYTRSFTNALNVLPIFDGMANRDNLSLYLSVDSANIADAKVARKAFPFVKWAWLAETFADGRAEMPESDSKRYNCPENGGRIPLISAKGSACIACGICPDNRGDVVFSIRKR